MLRRSIHTAPLRLALATTARRGLAFHVTRAALGAGDVPGGGGGGGGDEAERERRLREEVVGGMGSFFGSAAQAQSRAAQQQQWAPGGGSFSGGGGAAPGAEQQQQQQQNPYTPPPPPPQQPGTPQQMDAMRRMAFFQIFIGVSLLYAGNVLYRKVYGKATENMLVPFWATSLREQSFWILMLMVTDHPQRTRLQDEYSQVRRREPLLSFETFIDRYHPDLVNGSTASKDYVIDLIARGLGGGESNFMLMSALGSVAMQRGQDAESKVDGIAQKLSSVVAALGSGNGRPSGMTGGIISSPMPFQSQMPPVGNNGGDPGWAKPPFSS